MDAFALLKGNKGEQSDAPKAYTQCPMLSSLPGYKEQVAWVYLERGQWPPEWEGMMNPVYPLDRALYGHPLAGIYWEWFYTDVAVNKSAFIHILGWEW